MAFYFLVCFVIFFLKTVSLYLLDLYLVEYFGAWLRVVSSSREDLHLLLLGTQNHYLPRIHLNEILNWKFSEYAGRVNLDPKLS